MVDPIPFKRPVQWTRLRSDEAERIVRERAANTKNVIFRDHAFDRVEDRSITRADVQRILENGFVEGDPQKTKHDEWKVIVVMRLEGTREAGVVTAIPRDDGTLIVITVEWMDLLR